MRIISIMAMFFYRVSHVGCVDSCYQLPHHSSYLEFVVLCKYIRLLRNFFNWKVNTTYKVTTNLLLTATLWCFFPYKYLARWGFRIFVWSCFGPWIKLVDIFFIKKYYRTKEDLIRDGIPETEAEMKEEIANRPFILDPLVKSGWVRQLGHSGRIVIEVRPANCLP